jgi:hypothetical protein
MDCAAFQACFEERLPGTPARNNEEAIVKYAVELTSAINKALAASSPKLRPRGDMRPNFPASTDD